MRVHVAFTPAEAERAPTAIVVDVIRATSTIAQALAAGYRRILCCAEVEEALALRERLGEGVLAGERKAVAIPGFDLGNSPREFVEPLGETLVLTTTNGTRAILAAAASCGDRAGREPAQPRRRRGGRARRRRRRGRLRGAAGPLHDRRRLLRGPHRRAPRRRALRRRGGRRAPRALVRDCAGRG